MRTETTRCRRRRRAALARRLAGMLVSACLAIAVAGAQPAGRVTFLPVQDPLGDPEAVGLLESVLLERLGDRLLASDPREVRDHLRALRLRDPSLLTQPELRELARLTGGRHFLVVTLLDINREPVPRVTLSAKLLPADGGTLSWAGFVSATGIDSTPWLGLGHVHDWKVLLRQTAESLVEDLRGDTAGVAATKPLDDEPHVYRAPDFPPVSGRDLAIVPLDSVDDKGLPLAAQTATDLLYARMHARGARLLLPGTVRRVMLEKGVPLAGGVSGDLGKALAADVLLTGTVEAWRFVAEGLEPQPEVGLSLRFLEAGSGRIRAMGSLYRNGWSKSGLLELRRIHGASLLASRVTETLLEELLPPSGGTNHTRTP